MRPILVLLLVLCAAGALYLALNGGTTSSEGDGVEKAVEPARPAATGDRGGKVALQGAGGSESRGGAQAPTVGAPPSEARLTAPARDAGTVLGRVVDEDERAVADAEVVLTRAVVTDALGGLLNPDRSGDLRTVTAADGAFRFERVAESDEYSLLVRHPDFGPHEEGPVRVREGEVHEEPPIVLRPGARLFGTVFDSGGSPVVGARLTLGDTVAASSEAAEDADWSSAVSDAAGAFEFKHLADGEFVLTADADGFGRASLRKVVIEGGEDVERDIVLEVASAIGGRVVSPDGAPVAEAKVTAYSHGDQASRTQSATRSDARGEFLLQDVRAASYMLRVVADGYEALSVPRVQAGEMSLVFELVRLPKIRGRVLDSAGQPVKRFSVQLRTGLPNSDSSIKTAGTDRDFESADGTFELDCPMPGTFFVDAVAPGFAHSFSDPFTVARSQDLPGVIVTLRLGGTIRGRVVDAGGKPVRGAWIQTRDNRWTGSMFDRSLEGYFPGVAVERRVRTNDRGEFSIDALTPTTYSVEVTHKRFSKAVVRHIAVAEANETDVRDVTLFSGGTIGGVVRGPSGAPLAGAQVRLEFDGQGPDDFPIDLRARADKDGKYAFEHVKAGTYWVQATRPGRAGAFGQAAGAAARRRVTVEEGAEVREDLDLAN